MKNMIDLFNKYKNAGNIDETLLVGRNMVNKYPDDFESFHVYMDFLLMLAEKLPVISERNSFLQQANIVLAFFEENANLDSELIIVLGRYKNRIADIADSINTEEDEKIEIQLKEIQRSNNQQIKELYALNQELIAVNTQDAFDNTLNDIGLADSRIEHDYLTDEQQKHYDQLNKSCAADISKKMQELEHKKNISYNKRAVEAYSKAFKKFKQDENNYKNQSQLFKLVSSTLFAYDAGKLFNETLIFYNHVYTYIFSKLDDDGKLALTRFSIECERKLDY